MKLRLDVSWQMAQGARDFGAPLGVLDSVCGVAASRDTREAILHAESRHRRWRCFTCRLNSRGDKMKLPILSRRAALQGLSVSFAAAFTPRRLSAAGARDPRVVVIILRGALDG